MSDRQPGRSDEHSQAGETLPDPLELSPENRRIVARCLSALGFLGGGSLVGVASSLYLVNHYPLLLIALSPIGRHLILVAPVVDPIAFIAVGVVRRLAFYLGSFYLGRALGPSGITWLGARAAQAARVVVWLQSIFRRAPHVAVLLLPGPSMSTLAGMSGMKPGIFVGFSVLGLFFRMVIIISVAEQIREPIERLLVLIDEYWMQGTLVMVLLVFVYQRIQKRWGLKVDEDTRNGGA